MILIPSHVENRRVGNNLRNNL